MIHKKKLQNQIQKLKDLSHLCQIYRLIILINLLKLFKIKISIIMIFLLNTKIFILYPLIKFNYSSKLYYIPT